MTSYHKQIKNQTKYIKHLFWEIGQPAVQDYKSQEKRNNISPTPLKVPNKALLVHEVKEMEINDEGDWAPRIGEQSFDKEGMMEERKSYRNLHRGALLGTKLHMYRVKFHTSRWGRNKIVSEKFPEFTWNREILSTDKLDLFHFLKFAFQFMWFVFKYAHYPILSSTWLGLLINSSNYFLNSTTIFSSCKISLCLFIIFFIFWPELLIFYVLYVHYQPFQLALLTC